MNTTEELKSFEEDDCSGDVYNLTEDLFQRLNYMNFFNVGMNSPRDGKLAVEHEGKMYILSIERIDAPDINTALASI